MTGPVIVCCRPSCIVFLADDVSTVCLLLMHQCLALLHLAPHCFLHNSVCVRLWPRRRAMRPVPPVVLSCHLDHLIGLVACPMFRTCGGM